MLPPLKFDFLIKIITSKIFLTIRDSWLDQWSEERKQDCTSVLRHFWIKTYARTDIVVQDYYIAWRQCTGGRLTYVATGRRYSWSLPANKIIFCEYLQNIWFSLEKYFVKTLAEYPRVDSPQGLPNIRCKY